ncbi:hypothetical protein Tco_0323734 [Tanacetum coccineum]
MTLFLLSFSQQRSIQKLKDYNFLCFAFFILYMRCGKLIINFQRCGLAEQLEDLFFLHFLSMLIFIDDDQWINDELGADRMDGLVDLEPNNEEILMVVTRCNMVIKFVVKEHGRE